MMVSKIEPRYTKKDCSHCKRKTFQIDYGDLGWFCSACGNIFPKGTLDEFLVSHQDLEVGKDYSIKTEEI